MSEVLDFLLRKPLATSGKANVLWLHSDRFGCGTYRCYVPGLSLQELGFENHFLLQSHIPPRGFDDLADIHLVVFQRAVGTLFTEWMRECQRRGIVTVFETDDDLFNVPRHNPSGQFWARKDVRKVLGEELVMADAIVCSTPPLKEALIEEGIQASDITICYNHLHPTVWGPQVTDGHRFHNVRVIDGVEHPTTVIGWQGSNTHDTDFREVVPALARLVKEREDVTLRFFGSLPLSLRGHVPEDRLQWSKGVEFDLYPSQLAFINFDIGLAPVTNARFNQAKSNLKWLEYSAVGTPTVASKVYPYEKSIEQGVTGYVCETADDWYRSLTALLDDPALRQRMGARAKAHVWEHWGTSRALTWATLFTKLLRERHGEHFSPQLGRSPGDGVLVAPPA